ncbi:MAG TPA: PAS domain S-box protein [Cellvibrio sp.]|nr:PAS domain S-box protein [Cellvibrio sp.]
MKQQDDIQFVIDSLDRPILILDVEGNIQALNKLAATLLRQNCVGTPIWSLSWCNTPTINELTWKEACRNANNAQPTEFTESIKIIGDKTIPVNFVVLPMKNNKEKVIRLMVDVRGVPSTLTANTLPILLQQSNNGEVITRIQPNIAAVNDRHFIEEKNNPAINKTLHIPTPHEIQRDAWFWENESRFRLMVESIEDYAMFMVDPDGFITSWNRGAERLTGYTDIEAIGRHFSMLYPKDKLGKDHAAHELAMAQAQGRYEEEGVRVRKNGSYYHAQIIVWRIDNAEGNTVGYAKITRDITKFREAQKREAQLLESENRFRLMVESIQDYAMFMVDLKGNISSWNRGAERLTGYIEDEILGRPFSILYPKNALSDDHAIYELTMAREYGYHEEEGLRVKKDGTIYHAQIVIWPVEDKAGEIVSFAKITRDITDRKKAEQALKESEAILHESARRKDEYLAMLAHELRNPLAPIRNSTVLLRRLSNSDASLVEAVNVIDRQVVHMTRLIDDLLDVARISRGKIELRRETFELGELIKHTTNDFRTAYSDKGVNLRIDVPDTPAWLYADRTRIAQAVGNLLHNALKFTPYKGEVLISLREILRDGKTLGIINVKDTGIGIDPKLLEQLFEPFVQGNQDLARSKGGLGLGLALIKGFANLHGGTAYARSEGPGHGAEFIFEVPLSNTVAPTRPTSVTAISTEPLNVVLIDDNRDMVETLAALLAMDGHQVRSAYDGETGLQLIKSSKPQLVFCDIGLPGELDGYAVARQVRADPDIEKTFLVALSGYGQEKDRKLAFECGFNDHLLKPVDFASLLNMIKAASCIDQDVIQSPEI